MRYHVGWRLLFRVKDFSLAQDRIEEVRKALGVEVDVTACQQYWKMPGLWECSLKTAEMDRPLPEAVFDCLVLASKLAHGWFLQGPFVREGVLENFEGVFHVQANSSAANIAGLEWGSFGILSPQEKKTPEKQHLEKSTALR